MSDGVMLTVAAGSLGLIGALIVAAAMSGPTNDYTTLCQDADYVRLDDTSCDRGDRGSTVMFISTGSDYHAPPVGGKINQSKVVTVVPKGKTVQKGAIAKEGGVVKNSPGIIRQGFGSSSKGSAGG